LSGYPPAGYKKKQSALLAKKRMDFARSTLLADAQADIAVGTNGSNVNDANGNDIRDNDEPIVPPTTINMSEIYDTGIESEADSDDSDVIYPIPHPPVMVTSKRIDLPMPADPDMASILQAYFKSKVRDVNADTLVLYQSTFLLDSVRQFTFVEDDNFVCKPLLPKFQTGFIAVARSLAAPAVRRERKRAWDSLRYEHRNIILERDTNRTERSAEVVVDPKDNIKKQILFRNEEQFDGTEEIRKYLLSALQPMLETFKCKPIVYDDKEDNAIDNATDDIV
jgi:hypothetical protein